MSHLDDLETKWRREDAERVLLAAGCLGSLTHLIGDPDVPNRETRLAVAVADLRIALTGDEVARAELAAHNAEAVRRILTQHAATEGGDSRG